MAEWLDAEAEFARPELTLGELVGAYVRSGVEHRAISRIFLRESIEDVPDGSGGIGAAGGRATCAAARRRASSRRPRSRVRPARAAGRRVRGLVFPGDARRVTGLDPRSEEFAERYAEQLARLIAHLAR